MADGHKWMFGPEGLGVFYTTPESRSKLKLTQYGWHMMANTHNYENKPWKIHPTARRFECGSPNMLGIHAWSASLSLLLETGMKQIEAGVIENTEYLMHKIDTHSKLSLLGNQHPKLKSGIVLFEHKTIDTNKLYKHLQNSGVICALRGGGIRFSPHFYHTKVELERAIEIINQI
jgi:selenocysteine lyase/cysteine desulfurase